MPVTTRLRVARLMLVFLACAGLLLAAGCGSTAPTTTSTAASSPTTPAVTPSEPATETPASEGSTVHTPTYTSSGSEIAVIKTSKGTIKVKLYGKDAPISTANFIELARKGFYDGVRFHRLEPGFVIQGGDPQTKKLSSDEVKKLVADQSKGIYSQGQPMLGTGGPGYGIKGEFDPANVLHKHVDGTLAMARNNDPDSAGSQFYFTLAPQAYLDGKYAVFGDTVSGLEVVHKLGVGDEIISITIENATK